MPCIPGGDYRDACRHERQITIEALIIKIGFRYTILITRCLPSTFAHVTHAAPPDVVESGSMESVAWFWGCHTVDDINPALP